MVGECSRMLDPVDGSDSLHIAEAKAYAVRGRDLTWKRFVFWVGRPPQTRWPCARKKDDTKAMRQRRKSFDMKRSERSYPLLNLDTQSGHSVSCSMGFWSLPPLTLDRAHVVASASPEDIEREIWFLKWTPSAIGFGLGQMCRRVRKANVKRHPDALAEFLIRPANNR